MKRFLTGLVLAVLACYSALAQTSVRMQAQTVATCGSQSLSAGIFLPVTQDLTGTLCIKGAGSAPLSVVVTPGPATTTTLNSTITVTNTFQPALAASPTRKSCLIQNTGTHTEYVYAGTSATPTTLNSNQIAPLGWYSCAIPNGVVITDAIAVSGTSGDGYVVTSQ